MNIFLILGIVLGSGFGGIITYLWSALQNKLKIANLEKDLAKAQSEVADLVRKNAELTQKCMDTQAALANTLSALELIKAYQVIDQDTKNKIKDLQNTFVEGKASADTMNSFKDALKKMNESFSKYNKGKES